MPADRVQVERLHLELIALGGADARLPGDPGRSQVHFLWLEHRFGPGAAAYARCPDDPAQPCSTNELVSDRDFTFTFERNSPSWLGDYNGLGIGGNTIVAVWTDNRIGRAAIFAARGTLP